MPDSPGASSLRVANRNELILERSAEFESFFVLSPYVWPSRTGYQMMVRLVNRDDDPQKKIARIHRAQSTDGLRFLMDDKPVVAPGPSDDDDGGCEDPTVVVGDAGYDVYYSGYSLARRESKLLLARGVAIDALTKVGAVLPHDDVYANAKEASLVRCADGFRLFFEYSRDEASRIGCAASTSPSGPWHYVACDIQPRPGSWDAWHLSPGPIVETPAGKRLMLYNGATRDARWRIGWLELDARCARIIDRAEEPLIAPPPAEGDTTDIAFVASAVESQSELWLYYAIGDRQMMRAVVHW